MEALIATPPDETRRAARAASIASRPSCLLTEAYRFGNAIVDDWEGRVNAWPMDEGLIGYSDTAYGQSEESELSTLCRVRAVPVATVINAPPV